MKIAATYLKSIEVETMTRAYLKNKDDKVQRTLGKAGKSGVLDLRHPEMRDAKIDRIPEGLEELIIDSSYTHDVSFISRVSGLKRLKVYNHTDDFSFLIRNGLADGTVSS